MLGTIESPFASELSILEEIVEDMLLSGGDRGEDFRKIASYVAREYATQMCRAEITIKYKSLSIVYKMSKQLEQSLGPIVVADANVVMPSHAPSYVTTEQLADSIMRVWFDGIDAHVALAALRARDVQIAYEIRDAMAAPPN